MDSAGKNILRFWKNGVDILIRKRYNTFRNRNLRSWRNRQTRTFEGRMGDRMGSSPIDRTKNPGFPTRFFLCLKCLKPSIYKAFLSLHEFSWISLESLKIVCVARALHARCTQAVSGLLKRNDLALFCATALNFTDSFHLFDPTPLHTIGQLSLFRSDPGCTLFGHFSSFGAKISCYL